MNDDQIARIDAKGIDPNRVHPFIPNDQDRRCYRCGDKWTARIHNDPRR